MLTVIPSNSAQGGYRIANSLRFRSSASAYLNRTPGSAGNRQIWTWSGWVKRGDLATDQNLISAASGSAVTRLQFVSTSQISYTEYNGTAFTANISSIAVLRDPSAWYHITVAFNSTEAASADRLKIYVNGILQSVTTSTAISLNLNSYINLNTLHKIGNDARSGVSQYFDGYLTEINFIDGQALTPSSFGETDAVTGVWKPKRYAGTYGTNGFRLNFSNGTSTTTLGYDSSSNGNNWTTNNISLTAGSTYDWMIDSPTPYQGSSYGVGNYCVINRINTGTVTGFSSTSGNLTFSPTSSNNWGACTATIAMSSGKWYWEGFQTVAGEAMFGITASKWNPLLNTPPGWDTTSYAYYSGNGQKFTNASGASYGASYTASDIIGIAFDADAGTLTFYKNGVSQGVAFTGLTAGPYVAQSGCTTNGNPSIAVTLNFGQRPFAYAPPSGFKALCTQNLPNVSIYNGAQYMAATLYTGTGADPLVISGVGFQPDMVWIKSRSNALSHNIYDAVRGVSKRLQPNLTNAESSPISGVKSFNTNGFTLGNDTDDTNFTSGNTYVAWQWKAGGTAVTNTAGSITSQVSANTTAGFSVVTYTGNGTGGATVGHGGLVNLANGMIIVKRRDSAVNWFVGHGSQGWTKVFEGLNTTNAISTTSAAWNNTSPTSTVFTLGTETSMNGNGGTFVAYCFAAIPGYSAFGSYTGNGSADGVFIYLGFRPRYIMFKLTSTTGDWQVWDSSRDPYNVVGNLLNPNLSSAEQTGQYSLDFLSNGVKFRSGTIGNNSGQTYIYAAFAENPFKYSLAR